MFPVQQPSGLNQTTLPPTMSSLHTSESVPPRSEHHQIENTIESRLAVDLKRSEANTPAELSPSSVNSDPDDGCDKYSCRSGESEVTATVHDDVPETSIIHPSHSMFSASGKDVEQTTPSSTSNGPEATITTVTGTALPPNKKPNLLNTYMRLLFDHYKVNFTFLIC